MIAEDDVVDARGVDVAERVAGVGDGRVSEGGLRDVVAGVGVVGALQDGDGGVVVFGEIADDFAVTAAAIVGVAEVVEGVGAGRAVGVGCTVDVDIHAMGEDGEVLRGRRELGLWWGRRLSLRAKRKPDEEGRGEREGQTKF